MLVRDPGAAVLAGDEVGDQLHGAGAVERHDGDHVLEPLGPEPPERVPHAGRLELEHPERLGVGQELVGPGVVEGDRVQVDPLASGLRDQLRRVGEHGEGAEAEEVHLQQAELLDRPHRVARDQLGPLGVLVERDVAVEGLVGDDHRGGVDGGVARAALERLGDLPQVLHLPPGVHRLRELRALGERVVEGDVEREVGDELRDPVHLVVGQAEDAPDVPDGGLGAERAKGDDMGDPVAPVLLGHVADHLVAPVVGEVHVHVGHRDSLRVQEALEEEAVADRVDVRDAEAVRGERARRRPPAGADRDPPRPRVGDEVPDHEEVAGEAHLLDHGELVPEPVLDRLAGVRAVAPGQPLPRELLEVGLERVAIRHRVPGQVELAEVERQVAALRDRQRIAAGVGQLGEDPAHLFGRLQVELLGREPPALRVAHRRAGLDAEERLVGSRVPRLEVVRVVGAHDRRPDRLGDVDGRGRHPPLLVEAVGLDLHEVVVAAEDLLVPAGGGAGAAGVVGGEEARDLGVEAPGECQQPPGVGREQLPVHARLVVIALEVGRGDQPDQVAVAGEVPHEHGEVVRALVGAVLRAALGPLARRHVELAAEDRLDPFLLAGQVEVDGAEQVAVVGQRERREPELPRARDQLVELRGAVEQAVLGMDVQVDEVGVPLHQVASLAPGAAPVPGRAPPAAGRTIGARPRAARGFPRRRASRPAVGPIPTRSCWAASTRCRRPPG